MNDISRKKFLRVCGTIIAGGTIAGVSGVLVNRRMAMPVGNGMTPDAFASPYKRITSFAAPATIAAFDEYDGKLHVATANAVSVYDIYGKLLHRFAAGESIRDIAVAADGVYVLYPAGIAVYSPEGTLLRQWEACSELSDYCTFALASDWVFVTDRANRNICKYTTEGRFVRFIDSPNRFIIPSLTFGIECIDGVIYCSNSGRHQVETYTLEGEYTGSFGKAGTAPGLFTGCCNPVYITHTANGEVITSEKGDPRISCYSRDGQFRSILLDNRSLGGGHVAYDVKVRDDKIFVAGKDMVSVFRYNETFAAATASCSGCGVTCPLRI
jgi:hypothetical protein